MAKIAMEGCKCDKCGKEWYPRRLPALQCPKCKTLNWNKNEEEALKKEAE